MSRRHCDTNDHPRFDGHSRGYIEHVTQQIYQALGVPAVLLGPGNGRKTEIRQYRGAGTNGKKTV